MYERIINQSKKLYEVDWVVLSADMHSIVYSGTSFEDCVRWLNQQCEDCEDDLDANG